MVRFIVIDKTVSGAIVASHLFFTGEFWKDDFGQLFTKLHTPLIEGVDVPDDALHKDFVFVKSNE